MKEMKKNFRKITSLVVALAVMVTAVVFDVPATIVAEAAVKYSGTDNGLNWVIDDSGTLTISGNGAMGDYTYSIAPPWRTYSSSVTDIVVESGVTSIGAYAFYKFANAEKITIPDGVTSIGNEAFRDCSKLDNVVIPNGVTVIRTNTFQNCTTLKSITIPESVTSLALNAFYGCTSLIEVTIPGSVNSIGDQAFYGCTSLKSVNIPSGVTRIGEGTFNRCSNLECITVPGKVTSIGNNAFKGCTALTTAVFESVVPPTLGSATVFTDAPLEKISVPCGTVEDYKTAANWSAYANIIDFDEHKAIKHIAAKDPTCTETGNIEYWTCNCGEHKYSDADGSAATDVTIPIDANAHDWGDWSVSEHPAISTDGESKRTCQTNNAHTETKPIPKLTDTVWTKNETTKPTVSGTGSYTYTSDYGTVTVTVPKLTDTVWTKTETTKPTINTDGSYTYKSDYGTVTATVPKLTDPVWSKTGGTDPTVTDDGEYTYKSDYGTVTVTVPSLSNESVWTKDTESSKEPTEDQPGKDVYKSKDYDTVEVTLDPTGHTLTHVLEVPATETAEGTKEHWHCEGCGKDFDDENGTNELTDLTLPKAEHTHTMTHVPEVSATETTEGTKEHWHCEGCDKDFLDAEGTTEATATDLTIPKAEHTHTMTHIPEVSATETTEGKKEHWHCTGCGKDFLDAEGTTEVTATDLTIPKAEHTHTMTHVPEVPATETTEGTKEHWHCAGCNKDFADESGTTELTDLTIPEAEHTHTLTHVPEVSATETAEGTKEHWHCEGCKKDFADENGKKEITADELKIGKIEKEVQSGENAPTAELTTPKEELIDAVLTSEEQAVINDGKDVKIILTIEDATESVSSVDKTVVESKIESLTNYHLGQYLDVNLLKIIDGETEKIAETSAPITITFEIPAELRVSRRSYSVIRVHGGETTVLPDLDNDENTVTIRTDKFSTYALAYVENASASDPSGGSASTPTTPTPGGNPSGTTPSGGNPSGGNGNSWIGGNNSNSGNSGAASGNGNSIANESGSSSNVKDPSNDRNDDDSSDVEDDLSDDDDDSIDVDEDSSVEEGNSESGNSDQADNASSEDTAFSVDEEGHVSDESDGNPSTGVAVSFVPLAAAITVLMAAKRKKK